MKGSVRSLVVPVRTPFRLDLTANVLRRLSTNAVDTYTGGAYRRMLVTAAGPVALTVRQHAPDALRVDVPAHASIDAGDVVARLFGTQADLAPFYAAASAIPWLQDIVTRARGVKPPRYPSLWEALVNAVVFQQISIHAAAAILRRVVERYAERHIVDEVTLVPFIAPETIVGADAQELRALGLSVNKVVALRTLARAVLDGELDAASLDALPTPELVERLATFKGIGPWTAAVIALRGFGRLDIFPMKDSGVARSLKDLSGDPQVDAVAILATLGDQRGMLYYHLLIGRLAARGEIVL